MPDPNNPLFANTGSNPLLEGRGSSSADTNPLFDGGSEPTPAEESSFPWGKALMGGGVLAALALLTHSATAPKSVMNAGEFANSLRQQSMLSGLAAPKSALGNIGAAVEQSLLRRSLEPLKQFLSPQTAKDALSEYRANTVPPGITKFPDWLPTPGRVMQSLDTATQNALQRAGLTAEEAQQAVLQAPLPAKLQQALDSPTGRFLIPFRRTPFNQFLEGFDRMRFANPATRGVTAGYVGAGAVHGAATANDDTPYSLPLAIAAAGTHSVPYALGAMGGRVLQGASPANTNLASSILPVSEYGLSQSLEDPLAPFKEPAALKALKTLTGR